MAPVVKALLVFLGKKAVEYAKNYVMKSARARGSWAGQLTETAVDSVSAVQAGYRPDTPCRFVFADPADPWMFVHESGTKYRFTDGVSDGGSTPPIAREKLEAWADLHPYGKFKLAFYGHDATYRDAGCFVLLPGETEWQWLPLTRPAADYLFFQMLTVNGRRGEVFGIWRAVRRFGFWSWNRHRARDKQPVSTLVCATKAVKPARRKRKPRSK
jgi:hypothetical protein